MRKMRKTGKCKTIIFSLVSCLMMSFFSGAQVLAADAKLQNSDTLYHDISYEDELSEAEKVLSLGDISNVTTKLVLPYSYGIHINIDWKSSDESVVDLKGNVTASMDSEKDVTLAATLSSTKIGETKTKEFVVHVPKMSVEDILNQDAKETQEYIDYIINTGYVLPDSKELGIRSDISWELLSGEAEIKDGKLLKTKSSLERQPVVLKATLKYEGKTKEVEIKNIVLLDKYVGYILSYFAGKNESKEMYIAYSYDGVHWMRLNSADAVLTPKKGNRQIRDPYIMRKKDGSFAVFATNGWTSPMITIWDSENLETFDNERLCKLAEKGGVSSGFHTWAPECTYDPIEDIYYVYWSDPKANGGVGQIYYNTTKDFENYSQAEVFFEREFFIIDASIKKYKGDYYMVYDDATGDNDTGNGGRRIYAAKADSIKAGNFYPYSGVLSEGIAEGPFLLNNFKDNSWFVYYDYFSQHKFGLTTIDDLTTDNWEYKGVCDTMPWEEVRHGGAIPVTEKEMKKILAKWGKDAPEVSEIKEPKEVKAFTGTTNISEIELPKSVEVVFSDGKIANIEAKWNTADISFENEGKITINGDLGKGEFDYENPDSKSPQITINIERKPTSITLFIIIGIGVLVLAGAVVVVINKKKNK